jgi:hypothetical protein
VKMWVWACSVSVRLHQKSCGTQGVLSMSHMLHLRWQAPSPALRSLCDRERGMMARGRPDVRRRDAAGDAGPLLQLTASLRPRCRLGIDAMRGYAAPLSPPEPPAISACSEEVDEPVGEAASLPLPLAASVGVAAGLLHNGRGETGRK